MQRLRVFAAAAVYKKTIRQITVTGQRLLYESVVSFAFCNCSLAEIVI